MTVSSLPFRGIIALLAAAALSFFSAYMSVVGMYALFPAAGWVIIGSMISVEIAKFISAESAYDDWKVMGHWFRKVYKTMAVFTLMAITAMGVYGFLAKGHLEQSAPIAPVQLQISQKEARLGQLRDELGRLTTQQTQINQSVDALIRNSQSARDARAGLRARAGAATERAGLQTRIDAINTEMNQISQSLVPLRVGVSEVQAKLGPLQYVADGLGWKDPEAAVRLIILMLMFAFDPLAIVLLIDGTERITAWRMRPRDTALDTPEAIDESEDEPFREELIEHPPVEAVETEEVPVPYAVDEEPIKPVVSVEADPVEVIDTLPPLIPVPVPQTWAFEAEKSLFNRPLGDNWEPNRDSDRPQEDNWEPKQSGKLLLELQEIIDQKSAETTQTDKEKLIDILSRNPDFLDEVVNAVDDARRQPAEWLEIDKQL